MITYDEVAEWWEGSIYDMSTYPPSAWFNYCEQEGIEIDELRENPEKFEDAVEEMHAAGDNRTCECEWADHEKGCTWSKDGQEGSWDGYGFWSVRLPVDKLEN